MYASCSSARLSLVNPGLISNNRNWCTDWDSMTTYVGLNAYLHLLPGLNSPGLFVDIRHHMLNRCIIDGCMREPTGENAWLWTYKMSANWFPFSSTKLSMFFCTSRWRSKFLKHLLVCIPSSKQCHPKREHLHGCHKIQEFGSEKPLKLLWQTNEINLIANTNWLSGDFQRKTQTKH